MFEGEGVWVGEVGDDKDVDFGGEVEEAWGLVAEVWFCGREARKGSGRILMGVVGVQKLFGHFLQNMNGEREVFG